MPPIVAIDGRDAEAAHLRGWGRYAGSLIAALRAGAAGQLDLRVLKRGGIGPELLFEQLKLPLAARRMRAALVHVPNCWLPLKRPCPGVVTIHDLAFEQWPSDFARTTSWKYRALAPLAARSAERVIVPSSFTREDLIARYGVDGAKIRVIPEAPALAIGDQSPPPGRYLLAVGDLRRKKNLEALVTAFCSLRAEGLPHRLVLAGVDAGSGPAIRALAGDAPVELAGYVPDARLDALIRGAEVLIHPSPYEGFGLVVLEAMARGTPVLAARAGALPETGGQAAAYFDPSDPGDLARVLGALLADAGALGGLAAAGPPHASQFSWERTARQTVAVYHELL